MARRADSLRGSRTDPSQSGENPEPPTSSAPGHADALYNLLRFPIMTYLKITCFYTLDSSPGPSRVVIFTGVFVLFLLRILLMFQYLPVVFVIADHFSGLPSKGALPI